MTINDVAAHLNMSKSQIRYYEKVGLITVPRNDSGIVFLMKIQCLN